MPFTPEQIAERDKLISTAAFKAAVKNRAEMVKNSNPGGGYWPPEEQELKFVLSDWLFEIKTYGEGAKAKEVGKWVLCFLIDDMAHKDNGKEFRVTYMIWPPRKGEEDKVSIPTSRLRRVMDVSLDDSLSSEERLSYTEDESEWPDILSQIRDSKIRFRGLCRTNTWKKQDGSQGSERTIVIFGEDIEDGADEASEATEESEATA